MDSQIRVPSIGTRALVLEIMCYISCFFVSCVFPPLFILSFFCLTLYYYFIFICFISLCLSFFIELYLVSISFYLLFYKYSIKFVQNKGKKVVKKRNPFFRFGGKILLQSGFGLSQSHICIQIWIVCQK